MKTLRFTIIALLAISLGLSGCVEKEIPVEPTPEEVKSEITIDDDLIQNGLTFSRAEGEKSISFTTNEDWTLDITETSGREAWCNASATSGMKGQANVKFSVSGNPSYDDRSASVTIKAGTVTKTFTITQSYAGAEGDDSDKVVVLKEAGTMRDLLGDNYLDITSLKIIGPLNGGDIYYLRRMLGGNNFRKDDWGKLTTLDLSESLIVEGGDWYYETSELALINKYYTSENTIGSYMFFGCANRFSIILPDTVTSIGDSAFNSCLGLQSVTLPDGVTSIGDYAFHSCWELQSINLPDGITLIGDCAFSSCCFGLQSITLPDGITSIEYGTFADCYSLLSIILPDGIRSIGDYAFVSCRELQSITLPDGVTSIGDRAFWECENLQFITLPDGITSIGDRAFSYCLELQSINLPAGIEIIEPWTFSGCSLLKTVAISNNVASIGEGAFANCDELTDFYCHTAVPPTIACVDDVETFNSYGNGTTLYVPKGSISQYQSSDWAEYFKNIKEME